jgi:hypothetical protein
MEVPIDLTTFGAKSSCACRRRSTHSITAGVGIEGCSGAEAVAFRALVSSKRESCELAGDGVFSGGVTADGRAESRCASTRSKSRGSDGSGCCAGRYVDSGGEGRGVVLFSVGSTHLGCARDGQNTSV